MDKLEKDLQQLDKAALIAVIKRLLQQQPDLTWVVKTSLEAYTKPNKSIDPTPYRGQIDNAIIAAKAHYRDLSYREKVVNTLKTVQAAATEFNRKGNNAAAIIVYEVLVSEVIKHFNSADADYITFTTTLYSCIDGLDTCFADAEEDREMRRRIQQALFSIYRFFTDSYMDLDEDIPGLLVENATPDERQVIATWVKEAQAQYKSDAQPPDERHRAYGVLLHRLTKK